MCLTLATLGCLLTAGTLLSQWVISRTNHDVWYPLVEWNLINVHKLILLFIINPCYSSQSFLNPYRSGVGAPVVADCEGDYNYDSRKNLLEWKLPVIDQSNKTGSMEFSINGHPEDFFPVTVSFISKRSYCDIDVSVFTNYNFHHNGISD